MNADAGVHAERALLAIMLLKYPQAIGLYDLDPGIFQDASRRALYDLLVRRERSGDPTEFTLLAAALAMEGYDPAVIDEVRDHNPVPAAAPQYVELLVQRAKTRLLTIGIRQAADGEKSPERVLGELQHGMDVLDAMVNPPVRSADAATAVHQFMTRIHGESIATGLMGIDTLLAGGLRPSELTLIAAPPNVGKSILAGVMARNYALSPLHTNHALMISLEMPTEDIVARLVSSVAAVPSSRYEKSQHGQWDLSHADRDAFAIAFERLGDARLHFYDQEDAPSIGVREVQAEVRALNHRLAESGGERCGLVIVDYLQILDFDVERAENRANALGRVSKLLKRIALTEKTHVILVAAVRRRPDGGEPTLDDVRDSGEITYNADNILILADRRDLETSVLGNAWLRDAPAFERLIPFTVRAAKVRKGAKEQHCFLIFRGAIQELRDPALAEQSLLATLLR